MNLVKSILDIPAIINRYKNKYFVQHIYSFEESRDKYVHCYNLARRKFKEIDSTEKDIFNNFYNELNKLQFKHPQKYYNI